MSRWSLIACMLAACGGDDGEVEPRLLAGSPAATRALAFDARGTPVAIGGSSAFGLAYLQRRDGDAWIRAAGVAGFGGRAQLLGGGGGPLYAAAESSLYRLDDEASFAWSARAIPLGATDGTLFGTDAAGLVYALDLAEGDGNGAIVVWDPEVVRWIEVPGTRPVGLGAHGFTVAPDGRLAWIIPGVGIASSDGATRSLRLDCAADASGACTGALADLAFDDRDRLTFLACGASPRVFRLGEALDEVVAPPDLAICSGLHTIADGTSLLASPDPAGETPGSLYVLAADGTDWRRVAGAETAFRYLLRDRATAYAIGDGQLAHGIYELAF